MFIERINNLSKIKSIGACNFANNVAYLKGNIIYFKIFDIPLEAMHILKQEAISVGGDFITPKEAIQCKKPFYDGILIATLNQITRIIDKCKIQPFGLQKIANILQTHINVKSYPIQIMGVINITDDSFFPNSRVKETHKVIDRIKIMIDSKADIIDIGAASSRPGSSRVEPKIEITRLKDILIEIKNNKLIDKAFYSIDSYNYDTIKLALDHGFNIINDVEGVNDTNIITLAKEYKSKIIIMHNSWITPHKGNIVECVDNFFENKINILLENGIKKENIIIDIGFGFGKKMEDNIQLINALPHFRRFGVEMLVGASRKQTIGDITKMSVENRLPGTLAIHQIAIQYGVNIIRCHDVVEHRNMLDILGKFYD